MVDVGGVRLGAERPATVVPLTGVDLSALLAQAAQVAGAGPDLVEWRVDLAPGLLADAGALPGAGRELAAALGRLPLLVTVRTRGQGGAADLDPEQYLGLVTVLVGSGAADLVDVELTHGPDVVRRAVEVAHGAGVPVVISDHDWERTPARKEVVARLAAMVAAGADVAKVAVTPHDPDDLVTLLRAVREHVTASDVPVIAVAMGDLGAVLRLGGGVFGSAATFATVGRGSAPGQLDLDTVRAVLGVLHGSGAVARQGRHA